MKIKMEYIARVEGEGSVELEIKDGKLKDLKLNIWEPPRFFEGFLRGRRFDEVPDIVARICGICPVSHMATSIKALEKATGFKPSPEIVNIRKIMALSQMASSHVVHLYVLALPDYRRQAMITKKMEAEINRLIRMKEALNNVTASFGGRALHPVAMVVGGFTKAPSKDEVGVLMNGLESIREDAEETLKMASGFSCPDFEAETEYVCLSGREGYSINEGSIISNLGLMAEEDDYSMFFEETEIPYSNAKRTVVKGRGSLMVGALSRLNLNFTALHPYAKEAAGISGFRPSVKNPFMNNISQAIEIIHGISECMELLDGLTLRDFFFDVKAGEGFGSAATEAPRGLLCHQYRINRRGIVEEANIVTPTAHNFLSLEEALKKFVSENLDKPKKELILLSEMLIRAYDPCFSCSVH
jgi:coenzyme F420-reducing hydrogenase alpha subunit